jgi:parvulin-like peptidyl-prolyl isomerase
MPEKYLRMLSLSCGLAVLLFHSVVCYADSDEEQVLATIGDSKITLRDLKERVQKLSPGRKISQSAEDIGELIREMVRVEVFAREAKSVGLLKDKDLQSRIEEMTKNVLATEYTKRMLSSRVKVSDQEAESYYLEHLNEFKIPEKIKAPYILIRIPANAPQQLMNEKQAKASAVIDRLKKGEDFSRLSQQFSEDVIGEDPDYFARGRLQAEIEESVFGLKVGEISPILKNKDGLAIFKLEERIPEKVLSLEEVKGRVVERLKIEKERNAFDATERELFSKYLVQLKDQPQPTTTPDEKEADMKGKITSASLASPTAANPGNAQPDQPTNVGTGNNQILGAVLVEASKEANNEFDRVSVRVTSSTLLFKLEADQRQPATFGELKGGQEVQIWFTGPVLQSYPVQAEAKQIVVLGLNP